MVTHPGASPGCPFCAFAASAAPNEIHRDKRTVSFPPLAPAAIGHTLLIPRAHISDIWNLDEATAIHLASATLQLAHAIRSALTPEGLNIIQSNGQAASQTVPHLHVHLVPRWAGDDLPDLWPQTSPTSAQDQAQALEQIRHSLREAST